MKFAIANHIAWKQISQRIQWCNFHSNRSTFEKVIAKIQRGSDFMNQLGVNVSSNIWLVCYTVSLLQGCSGKILFARTLLLPFPFPLLFTFLPPLSLSLPFLHPSFPFSPPPIPTSFPSLSHHPFQPFPPLATSSCPLTIPTTAFRHHYTTPLEMGTLRAVDKASQV